MVFATIGTPTTGSLDLSRGTDTGMATPQTKRRAPASPGIFPGKTIPEYSKCTVEPTDIMREVIHAVRAGRDNDRLVQALRTSLEKTVTSLAQVADAVNSHAEHFKLHHEGISWCVQRFRTMSGDVQGEVQKMNVRTNQVEAAASELLQKEIGIQQALSRLATTARRSSRAAWRPTAPS